MKDPEYCIFFDGVGLPTIKKGATNSNGGIVLFATLPTGEAIKWRSNDTYGRKGFSYHNEITHAKDDKVLSPALRKRLEMRLLDPQKCDCRAAKDLSQGKGPDRHIYCPTCGIDTLQAYMDKARAEQQKIEEDAAKNFGGI